MTGRSGGRGLLWSAVLGATVLAAVPPAGVVGSLAAGGAAAATSPAGGIVTDFPVSSFPRDVIAGPDGALWFTELEQQPGDGSIGRITTAGVVTTYTDPTILSPGDITAGPDGALWFTDERAGNSSIGRIDPSTHVVTSYTDPDARVSGRHHGGARWCAVVHERRDVRGRGADRRQGLDRAHRPHDARHHELPRREHRVPGPHRRRVRRRPLVHEHRRIGCGRHGVDRADHHERDRHQLHGPEHRLSGADHGGSGRQHVVHQRSRSARPRHRLDRKDHPCRSRDELHGPAHRFAVRHHRRAGRRPVVDQFRELDRADHDCRDRHHVPEWDFFEPVERTVCDHRRSGWRAVVHDLGRHVGRLDRTDHDEPDPQRARQPVGGSSKWRSDCSLDRPGGQRWRADHRLRRHAVPRWRGPGPAGLRLDRDH